MVEFSKYTRMSFLIKLATLIVGVVDVGLTSDSYVNKFTEKPFLSVVCIAFSLSLIFLIGTEIGFIPDTVLWKRIEIGFYSITALLLFMTASVFFFSVIEVECSGYCGSWRIKRYLASLFGFINGFLYGFVTWNLLDIKIVSKTSSNPA